MKVPKQIEDYKSVKVNGVTFYYTNYTLNTL